MEDRGAAAAQQFVVAAAGGSVGLDAGAAALGAAAAAAAATAAARSSEEGNGGRDSSDMQKGGGRWVVDAISFVCSGCHQAGAPDVGTLAAKLAPLVHTWVTTGSNGSSSGSNDGGSGMMDVDAVGGGGGGERATSVPAATIISNPIAELDVAAAATSAISNAKTELGCWMFKVLFGDALVRESTMQHLVRAFSLALSLQLKGKKGSPCAFKMLSEGYD